VTALEVREAAANTLHLPGHPSDDTLLRGLLALVDRDEMQALEIRRQFELAGGAT
jgi:hypothetical protein